MPDEPKPANQPNQPAQPSPSHPASPSPSRPAQPQPTQRPTVPTTRPTDDPNAGQPDPESARRERAVAEAAVEAEELQMDETIPGGVYKTPDGRTVDAEGNEYATSKLRRTLDPGHPENKPVRRRAADDEDDER